MDDEIWLARIHSDSANARQNEYIWSIYRIVPYGGSLPQAQPSPPASAEPELTGASAVVRTRGRRRRPFPCWIRCLKAARISTIRTWMRPSSPIPPRARLFPGKQSLSGAVPGAVRLRLGKMRSAARAVPGDVCLVLCNDDSGFYFFREAARLPL